MAKVYGFQDVEVAKILKQVAAERRNSPRLRDSTMPLGGGPAHRITTGQQSFLTPGLNTGSFFVGVPHSEITPAAWEDIDDPCDAAGVVRRLRPGSGEVCIYRMEWFHTGDADGTLTLHRAPTGEEDAGPPCTGFGPGTIVPVKSLYPKTIRAIVGSGDSNSGGGSACDPDADCGEAMYLVAKDNFGEYWLLNEFCLPCDDSSSGSSLCVTVVTSWSFDNVTCQATVGVRTICFPKCLGVTITDEVELGGSA